MIPWIGALLAGAAPANELEVDHSGSFQNDLRFKILDDFERGPWYARADPLPGVARNQLIFNNRLLARSGPFRGVADVDLVVIGTPEVTTLDGLTSRRQLEPFRIESHAAYLEGRDLGMRGIDLRLGQQRVQFGVGDQFNPTNTVNPDDVEDVLLFGEQQANLMARLDLTPQFAYDWTLTGVVVPIFKPALLPANSGAALTDTSRLPWLEDPLRWRVHAEQAAALQAFGTPTVVQSVRVRRPRPGLGNMQTFARLGGTVGMQDVGLSYYRGFSDVPQPVRTHTTQRAGPLCRPRDGSNCVDSLLLNETTLGYPRIQVLGFNAAGEVNPLGWLVDSFQAIGYRAEIAATFPERQALKLTQDQLDFGPLAPDELTAAGEYDYDLGGARPTVLDDRPYPQWVLGLDYTFGPHVYANAQWVHGMLSDVGAGDRLLQDGTEVRTGGVLDETTALACAFERDGTACAWEFLRPRQSDLAVVGVDINFASRSGLLRLFTITDFTGMDEEKWDEDAADRVRTRHGPFSKRGYSQILLPQLGWNFGNGLNLEGGALLQLGEPHTKFGAPENGGSFLWTRAKYSF